MHPQSLTTKFALAVNLRRQGRQAEGEALLREVVENQATSLGSEHPDTLRSMDNLAHALLSQSKFVDAEKLCQRSFQIRQRLQGLEHPQTLTSLQNLAASINRQGRHAEATELNIQLLETSTRVLGADQPITRQRFQNLSVSCNQLARELRKEKRFKEAITYLERAIKAGCSGYAIWSQLAACQRATANQDAYEDAWKLVLQEFPDAEKRDVGDWGHFSQCLYEVGQFSEASEALRKTIELRGDKGPSLKGGPRWWYYTLTLCHLGETEEARDCYEQLSALMRDKPPKNFKYHARFQLEVAELLGLEAPEGIGMATGS
jgi:tetratricopeptide (TPR) repeat protein